MGGQMERESAAFEMLMVGLPAEVTFGPSLEKK